MTPYSTLRPFQTRPKVREPGVDLFDLACRRRPAYQMVKDLRTNVERSDPQKVLDGDLDEFMAASLAARVGEGQEAA
jgi:hypothetical protein